jgi:hypothetical protein
MSVFVPEPAAAQPVPTHTTALHCVLIRVVPIPVHETPLWEYARVFVPAPPAIHIEPFHAAQLPVVENGAELATHVVPLLEKALKFVPEPRASTKLLSGWTVSSLADTFAICVLATRRAAKAYAPFVPARLEPLCTGNHVIPSVE